MKEITNRFCVYSSICDFGDFTNINKELEPYNAGFIHPQGLGGGTPDIEFLYIVLPILKDFALSGGYDIFKTAICRYVNKYLTKCKEKNKKPGVKITYKRSKGSEYLNIQLSGSDCTPENAIKIIETLKQ